MIEAPALPAITALIGAVIYLANYTVKEARMIAAQKRSDRDE